MSGRSPSNSGGVASLRARFEENSKHESPPSRGRSPAGSVASDSSRPISKVRASFIAVEPMGDLASTKEAGKTERSVTGKEMQDDKPVPEAGSGEGQGLNGKTDSADPDLPPSSATGELLEKVDGSTVEATDVNPDKPTSIAEDTTASMLPSDPKSTQAVSNGGALAEDVADLGSILKGSSFETKAKPPGGELKKDATPKKPTTSSHPQSAAKASGPAKTSAASAGTANGKPKEPTTKGLKPLPLTDKAGSPAPAPVATSTSTPAPAPTPAPTSISTLALTSDPTPAPGPASTTASAAADAPQEAPETGAPIATDISKEKPEEAEPTPTEEATSNANTSITKSVKDPAGPKAPTGSTSAAKSTPSTTNASTPKSLSQAKAAPGNTKPGSKMPGAKPGNSSGSLRSSLSKEALVPSNKTNKSAPKKTGPTSPTTSTKPRPKSPTRPVRLSSHLTAPTAASAAKLDHSAPAASQQNARSPSRASNAASSKPVSSKPISLQQRTNRPPRASMPSAGIASSKPLERPKGRQSLAGGTKTSGDTGSFLERMMRPTQSSAQKTHDKVEVAGKHSPPSKKSTVAGGSRSTSLNLENKLKGPAADKARAAPPGAASAAGPIDEAEKENGGKDDGSQAAGSAAPVAGDTESSVLPEPAEAGAGENGISADETAEPTSNEGAAVAAAAATPPTATAEKPLVPQPVVDAGETF